MIRRLGLFGILLLGLVGTEVTAQKGSSQSVRYVGIRFFESSLEAPALNNRAYSTEFPRSSARYISAEIEVRNLRQGSGPNTVDVKFRYFKEDGSLLCDMDMTHTIPSEYDQYYLWKGWGWPDADNWTPGKYRVEISINGTYVGQGSFTITGTQASVEVRFRDLLMEFERQTRSTSQIGSRSTREEWLNNARSAVSVRQLATALGNFGASIKWELMSESWSDRIGGVVGVNLTPGWASEVFAAQNLNTLVDLLIELEAACKWEVTEEAWRTRRDGWLAELRALKNARAVAPPVAPSAAATEFAKLLLELEQRTRSAAQVDPWPGMREEWMSVARSAVTPRELGAALAPFAMSIKFALMSDGWSQRIGSFSMAGGFTPGWMREANSTDDLNTLVDLLIELEAACKWEVTDDTWRTRRDGWLAEVRALKKTSR